MLESRSWPPGLTTRVGVGPASTVPAGLVAAGVAPVEVAAGTGEMGTADVPADAAEVAAAVGAGVAGTAVGAATADVCVGDALVPHAARRTAPPPSFNRSRRLIALLLPPLAGSGVPARTARGRPAVAVDPNARRHGGAEARPRGTGERAFV